MSIPFVSHEAATQAVERQFLDWFPYRVEGTINCLSTGFTPTVPTPAYPLVEYAMTRAGFAAPNAGKLFAVSAATPNKISTTGLSAAAGSGDELLLLYPTPVNFITANGSGRWVVGTLLNDKPFVELEIQGGRWRPYENIGGAVNYRVDNILDVRLHVPLAQSPPFNLQDRADACFRDWKQDSMVFEGDNQSGRINKSNSIQIKPGFSVSVVSYRYWYVVA